MMDLFEHLTARSRNETITNASYVHQILALIIADDKRVESMRTRKIPTYDELLAAIYSILYPRAGSFSRFVPTVLAFSDNSFQLLLTNCCNHVGPIVA